MNYKYIKYKLLVVLFIIVFFGKNSSLAQKYDENDIKAVYLYNFSNFVSWTKPTYKIWPNQQPNFKFVIGIFGENHLVKILENVTKQNKKQYYTWEIRHYTKAEEIDSCNMLFFSGVKTSEVIKVFKHIKGKQILTVGDNIANFCHIGGIINFLPASSAKPFEINNKAALNERLKISPKLLRLAEIIEKNE